MKVYRKRDFPTDQVRRFLEPGPIVLVSSAHKGERNIMTLGWHMVMGFAPALVATYIWDANHSFGLVRGSKECVINLPSAELIDTVVAIGNSSGEDIDKFDAFGLQARAASVVGAPLIDQCYASFECRLYDGSQVRKHGLFIWEVVKAHVAPSPKLPRTLHYRGDGQFMLAGKEISHKRGFLPDRL